MYQITFITAALAAVAGSAVAQTVSGTPEGFAYGTTGGAAGETVTPASIDELVSYLESSDPLTVLLTQEFNFIGSEGSTTEAGCAPWGTGSTCQQAINANGWCDAYQSSAEQATVTYDVAGTSAINVASDKTILGVGSAGVIRGKGLAFGEGVSNVIVQNIEITELNPQYVWGGDAISLDGCSNIWIDHVKVSLIGRMFVVAHYTANTGITISNSEFDGQTDWSASCDGYHYWTFFLTGDGDQITLKNNYVHHTSGRSPKVDAGSFVHVVNNYWYENSGHCFEGHDGSILVEGNTFENVVAMESDLGDAVFASASDSDACSSALGRACMGNAYVNSPDFEYADTSVLDLFSGLEIADAVDAASATSVAQSAGNTLSGSSSTDSNVVVEPEEAASSAVPVEVATSSAYPAESATSAEMVYTSSSIPPVAMPTISEIPTTFSSSIVSAMPTYYPAGNATGIYPTGSASATMPFPTAPSAGVGCSVKYVYK